MRKGEGNKRVENNAKKSHTTISQNTIAIARTRTDTRVKNTKTSKAVGEGMYKLTHVCCFFALCTAWADAASADANSAIAEYAKSSSDNSARMKRNGHMIDFGFWKGSWARSKK